MDEGAGEAWLLAKPTRRPRVQFCPACCPSGCRVGLGRWSTFSLPPGQVPWRDPIYTLPGVPRLMGSCMPAPGTALQRTAQSLPRLVVPCTATYAGGTGHYRSSHRSSDTSASPRGETVIPVVLPRCYWLSVGAAPVGTPVPVGAAPGGGDVIIRPPTPGSLSSNSGVCHRGRVDCAVAAAEADVGVRPVGWGG